MSAVSVDLDSGLRLGFGVGVSTEVRTAFHDKDPLVELSGHPLGDGQAEEAGADDEQVEVRR